MFKIAVLISGNGSNLEALIDACKKNLISGSVEIIISNNPDAYGIQRAKNHFINYKIIDNNRFETREDFDRSLVEELQDSNPDLIVLAGFMRILTPVMIEAFKNKIINIHPSLPLFHLSLNILPFRVFFLLRHPPTGLEALLYYILFSKLLIILSI